MVRPSPRGEREEGRVREDAEVVGHDQLGRAALDPDHPHAAVGVVEAPVPLERDHVHDQRRPGAHVVDPVLGPERDDDQHEDDQQRYQGPH